MKVDILALLASDENAGLLLKEFTRYVADSSVPVRGAPRLCATLPV
jgi:hypothetical protein